jgi:hypothetical protein
MGRAQFIEVEMSLSRVMPMPRKAADALTKAEKFERQVRDNLWHAQAMLHIHQMLTDAEQRKVQRRLVKRAEANDRLTSLSKGGK